MIGFQNLSGTSDESGDLMRHDETSDVKPSRPYEWTPVRKAFALCAVEHVVILLLAGSLLDGGRAVRLCALASLAFWAGVLFLALCRRMAFGPSDRLYVVLAYPVLALLLVTLADY